MAKTGGTAIVAALLVAACGPSPEEKAETNAAIQNFTPPFVMSRLDFGGVVERRFRRLDRNEDDRIDRSEISPRLAPRFAKIDTNGDGGISNEEWSAWMIARFDKQDENRDGTVTSQEREKARAQQEIDLPTPAEEPATNGTGVRK
ncbi:hypothetical protein ASG29_01040 [Sphingomonas sp. Leaf412]|uniref:hypothetical protein n=1 Tax=Sphingomonas sp. Leaf412 TaxID=1736370 RepID=UPI0006F56FF4|nr:hypothetical protein [Sphingomonas sp. Leaf412]KQT34779.1 hypothetical protein ASG29_01040 [Sphingomonas sp. Leaf412]